MIAYPSRALLAGTFAVSLSASMGIAPTVHAASIGKPAASGAAHRLHTRTHTDLTQSMRGEAFANASYTFFAMQAQRQGLPSIARLFRRTAKVELAEHFTEEAALSGLVGGNAANVRATIAGEGYEATIMYPTFARQAKADGDTAAAEVFADNAKDEAAHRAAFLAALRVLRTGKGTIPAPPTVKTVALRAGLPKVRSPRTRTNLDTAMHGEALAHAKYTLYAQHAARTGNAALARLFTGTAKVELNEHFAAEAALAGVVRTTRTNLGKAIAGERYESGTMYPTFAKKASAIGDTAAARLFRHNARDEARHARAFRLARGPIG